VLGDLCKRCGGEIAAAERDDPLAVQAPALRDASGRARDRREELELPGYAVVRVDS
jgi:hypothetical protein